ncbi:3-hydroxyacyl-CoA dehydratase 2 [Rhynchophorus ferrugineus]|uniref:3-hydroxyacyl-CoA dehydratase 2 n=1 Tax=Rhynchophorus ferrugineus TaxID=354439 RepID=UPI003FCCFDE0
MSSSPFVYWAQSENCIFLKIDLKDVKEPNINIEQKSIKFQGVGTGAQGSRDYSFCLNFYDDIDKDEQSIKVKDHSIDVKLVKKNPLWWPRLIPTPQKPLWLKTDFDRWQSEDDLEDKVNDIRMDYPDIYESLQKNELGYLKEEFKKVYLLFYNVLMLFGFIYVFVVMTLVYIKSEFKESPVFTEIYPSVGQTMCILHLFQCLESMHPIFGYVKGSLLFPAMQIGGRLLILFGCLEFEPRLQKMPVVAYLFFTWTSVELLRYSYYIVNLTDNRRALMKKILLPPLQWLRYSAWIILYPVGFTCEIVIIFRNVMYLQNNPRWYIAMPNKYNFTFDYFTYLRIHMLLFMIPGMYALLNHMYNMRRKKIGGYHKGKVL